jgi:hypothetical protein
MDLTAESVDFRAELPGDQGHGAAAYAGKAA